MPRVSRCVDGTDDRRSSHLHGPRKIHTSSSRRARRAPRSRSLRRPRAVKLRVSSHLRVPTGSTAKEPPLATALPSSALLPNRLVRTSKPAAATSFNFWNQSPCGVRRASSSTRGRAKRHAVRRTAAASWNFCLATNPPPRRRHDFWGGRIVNKR